MRTTVCLMVLLSMVADVEACWCWRRCQPRRVPVAPPAEVVPPKVEAKPAVDPNDAPDGWCHVTGQVVFDGANPPKQRLIRGSGGAYTEEWVIDPSTKAIANVVVWIVPEPTAGQLVQLKEGKIKELPSFRREQAHPGWTRQGSYVVWHDHERMSFVPHVNAVQQGSSLTFDNRTPFPQGLKWDSRNNGTVDTQLQPRQTKSFELLAAERFPIEVTSRLHPWMKAWLRVFDHPYYAVTDSEGKFEIRFVPKGKVRVLVWQEEHGMRNGVAGRAGESFELPDGRRELGKLSIKREPTR